MKHLVIGLGSIGARHAGLLLDAEQDVVGLDVTPRDACGFTVYTEPEPAWDEAPDMVWVCTPTSLHAKFAVEGLNRGCHVFIEKPIAESRESALAIQQAWEQGGENRLVWAACNMRFHPAVIELKKAIDSGRIGRPLVYRIHFSHYLPNMRPRADYRKLYAASAREGGVLLDGIHEIDLALWMAGPVREAVGMAVRSGALDMESEDVAHASLLHENGALTELHLDYLRRDKSRGIEVVGTEGALEWRSRGKSPERGEVCLYGTGDEEPLCIWRSGSVPVAGMYVEQLAGVLAGVFSPDTARERTDNAIAALDLALQLRCSRRE